MLKADISLLFCFPSSFQTKHDKRRKPRLPFLRLTRKRDEARAEHSASAVTHFVLPSEKWRFYVREEKKKTLQVRVAASFSRVSRRFLLRVAPSDSRIKKLNKKKVLEAGVRFRNKNLERFWRAAVQFQTESKWGELTSLLRTQRAIKSRRALYFLPARSSPHTNHRALQTSRWLLRSSTMTHRIILLLLFFFFFPAARRPRASQAAFWWQTSTERGRRRNCTVTSSKPIMTPCLLNSRHVSLHKVMAAPTADGCCE